MEDLIFSPQRSGSQVGTGISSSGELTASVGPVAISANYAVVFRCAHGRFVVEGSGPKHKGLWQVLQKGQHVELTFRSNLFRGQEGHGFHLTRVADEKGVVLWERP